MEDEIVGQQQTPKSNATYVIVALAMFFAVSIGGNVLQYINSTNQITKLQNDINSISTERDILIQERDALTQERDALTNELDLLKNPPIPDYCENGEIYEFSDLGQRICITSTWKVSDILSVDNDLILVPLEENGSNQIAVRISNDSLEDALRKYSKEVYVDTTDRDSFVSGEQAIQVTGTIPPDKMRAITVFTYGYDTFEIVLDNDKDTSYGVNLQTYKNIVSSFEKI